MSLNQCPARTSKPGAGERGAAQAGCLMLQAEIGPLRRPPPLTKEVRKRGPACFTWNRWSCRGLMPSAASCGCDCVDPLREAVFR